MSNKMIRELRDKSEQELVAALRTARESLYRLKTDQAMRRLEDPNGIQKRRKEVARILTLQRQREIAREAK